MVVVVQDAPINAGLVVRQLVLGSVKEQVTPVHIINVVADGWLDVLMPTSHLQHNSKE